MEVKVESSLAIYCILDGNEQVVTLSNLDKLSVKPPWPVEIM